jgi:hypothetical protein
MSDSDMSDSDGPEPSRRPARASTVKQRTVDRPPIKKRTAKKAPADFDADAKLKVAAVVIDDKDKQLKQLRDREQKVLEKEHDAQFMAAQMEDMSREKTAALNLAAEKDREARSSAEQIQVYQQQIADLNAEKQEIMRASCAGMRSAMESFMEADTVLDTASGMVDDAGQILSSLEAVVNAEPRQVAPATGMQRPCAGVVHMQTKVQNNEQLVAYRELVRAEKAQQVRLAKIEQSIQTYEVALARAREQAVREEDIARILEASEVAPLEFTQMKVVPAQVDLVSGAPSHDLGCDELDEMLRQMNLRR